MHIIKRSKRVRERHFRLAFDYEGEQGWGFSFPCDEHGNVDVASLQPAGREAYAACLAGEVVTTAGPRRMVARGVQSWERSYTEPAEGKCECGRIVQLDAFTNPCDCGRDYNMSGQKLAPREQWGEETGEHWSDCF